MMSKAQVSEAKTTASPIRPMASGRNPEGSRIAASPSSHMATIEYAPSASFRALCSAFQGGSLMACCRAAR